MAESPPFTSDLADFVEVVKEALASAFDLCEDTSWAQAELVIEEVPLIIHCSACAADSARCGLAV